MDILTLEDIYTPDVITLTPQAKVTDALTLMQKSQISAVIVVAGDTPLGIFTERDAVKFSAQRKDVSQSPISAYMNTLLVTAEVGADFRESYQLMNGKGLRHLVIVDEEGRLKGIITEADFLNHIGMEYLVEMKTVASAMTSQVKSISREAWLGEAVDIMATQQISCVVIEEKGCAIGIITERDVVHYAQNQKNLDETPVEMVMSHPPHVIRESASLQEAIRQMGDAKIRRLIVITEEKKIAGLVTRHDIVKALEGNYIAFLHETISRQKQELESVKSSLSVAQEHQLFSEIVDQVHDGIIVVNALNGAIIDVNKEACKQLEYCKEELLQLKVMDFSNLAEDIGAWKTVAQSYQSENSLVFETEYQTKSGRTLPVEISIRYFDSNSTGMVIFSARDITERKNSEIEHNRLHKQLVQAQKMEAIGQLTGGIAHDFNNILAAILGYNGLALSRFSNVSPPKLVDYLNEVKLAGERGRDLISQMLLFSRGGETEAKAFYLAPLIKEGVKMMRSSLPSTINIHTHMEEDLPAVLMAPVQLHQILMNLFINARDAMGEKGNLAIMLHWAKDIDSECSSCHKHIVGHWISLTVTDNGHGMTQKQLEQIFAPFYTTKESGKGTGMGLSVVHGILHKHNAHIVVQSIPGNGATFQLLFQPVDEQPEPDQLSDLDTITPLQQQTKTILLVDDEKSVAGFMEELLINQGFEVKTFYNPTQALKFFTQSPDSIDLLITDQTMPEMTGIELIRFCKELNHTIPIIMCTGYSEQIDEKKSNQIGIDHFFHKPIDTNLLLKTIDELLQDN